MTPPPGPKPLQPPIPELIGTSPAMQRVYALIEKVARSNASVLLLGETGTGKELVARAIHRLSNRESAPFISVNCGALAENLLESELFGHVHGAFTGAVKNRTGRFEAAHTGTIFLDEINSTSLMLQVKLLRVLQEREFERVGDTQTIRVDVRVIAASNCDLWRLVEEGAFREDLYWRLNVVPIEIPPLRERREDIPALISHFLDYYNEVNDRYVLHMSHRAIELFQRHDWPGNVRELQNYIERAVVTADGDEVTEDLLPDSVHGGGKPTNLQRADMATLTREVVRRGLAEAGENDRDLHQRIVDRVERELIQQVLAASDFVQTKAAARLGINRNTLHKKIKEYGLDRESS